MTRIPTILAATATTLAVATQPAAATRGELLTMAVTVADRLAEVKEIRGTWHDAPYLVGSALVWEQLESAGESPPQELWDRVDRATGPPGAPIVHGDDAAYAQAALDLYRLSPVSDTAFRTAKLAATDEPIAFAELVLTHDTDHGLALDPWWVGDGYGTRYWQDDAFTIAPWLAMRGSSVDGLPGEERARNLAYEWIEAYAFDHRKAVEHGADRKVPTRPRRRRSGWVQGDSATGRLLYDPGSGLWWHDEDDPGSAEFWTRGNGWVAAALVRAQRFLDAPYTGGRFEVVPDRVELRRMLSQMARTIARERNVYGTWNADIVRRDRFTVPESSGSALLVYMLARGVNEGWLDETRYAPVVLKAFHTLILVVDPDGDLHHIQRPAAGPETGPFFPSDDPDVNVNYGVGALLMAAAEVARLDSEWLEQLESIETVVVDRSRFSTIGDDLSISVAELGEFGATAAAAAALGAISDQLFLAARYSPEGGGEIRVDNRGTGDVALFLQPTAEDALLPQRVYLVPAVANTPGVGDTRWRSDVVVHNPTSQSQAVTATFRSHSDPGAPLSTALEVPAQSSVTLNDVVASVFAHEGRGTLEVAADGELVVTSRTYTSAGDGRLGQSIPALERHQSLVHGDQARLLLLGRDENRRTNLGCANFSSLAAEVELAIHAADGTALGTIRTTVPGHGSWQRTDALATMLPSGEGDAYAVVRVLTPGRAVAPYASVVDAATGDPSLILAAAGCSAPVVDPAGAPPALLIPAAAHAVGLNGTLWRTDLELHNPGPDPASLSIALLASATDNSAPPIYHVPNIAAGASLRFADVVQSLFQASGSGALRITPELGTVLAASRTYTVAGAGTFGQHIPGATAGEAIHHGQVAVVSHLAHMPDTTVGRRTNIGCVNRSGDPLSVSVILHDGHGTAVGSMAFELAPYAHRQVTNVYGTVGAGSVVGGHALVRPLAPGGSLYAYASVVDNLSGDPHFLPARRAPEEGPGFVDLDNRSDTVLVDRQ